MAVPELFDDLGVTGTAFAAPIGDGEGIGSSEHELVGPASVLKIQGALTIESAITDGSVDGTEIRTLHSATRTPGRVGISLLRDDVQMSVRDLVPLVLTISDNVATELLSIVGVEQVNRTTERLGLRQTRITTDLRSMLDDMAVEAGLADYPAMVRHDPDRDGPPSEQVVRERLAATAALDPDRGSRTTAFDMVSLLRAIWRDAAGPASA